MCHQLPFKGMGSCAGLGGRERAVEGGQPGASSLLARLTHALVRALVRADVERAALPTLSGSHSDVSPIASPSSFYLPYRVS